VADDGEGFGVGEDGGESFGAEALERSGGSVISIWRTVRYRKRMALRAWLEVDAATLRSLAR